MTIEEYHDISEPVNQDSDDELPEVQYEQVYQTAVQREQSRMLHEFEGAIKEGNIEYLENNRELIKRFYDENVVSRGVCGMDGCNRLHTDSIFTTLCHPPAYRWGGTEDNAEFLQKQENFYQSVSFLLREGIIDVSKVIDITEPGVISTDGGNKVVLAVMFHNFGGWAFQRRMIDLYLNHTPLDTIMNFRDRGNCTLLQLFLQSHGYDEGNDIEYATLLEQESHSSSFSEDSRSEHVQFVRRVRDRLMPEGLSLNHLCSYDSSDWDNVFGGELEQTQFSPLDNAVNADSLVVIRACIASGANPNLINTDRKYHTRENMLMSKLYRMRYIHDQEYIDGLAEIVKLLCQAGFNLLYETTEGRNIRDYMIQHGWLGTPVEDALVEGARNQGIELPPATNRKFGWKFLSTDNDAEADMNPAQRLLYINRFEKNPERLGTVYEEWASIDDHYKKMGDIDNDFIGRYRWRDTPIDLSVLTGISLDF